MTNVKRSRIEICGAILEVARNGALKSHIIYKANLNFKIGKKYLGMLIESGLISPANENRVFTTTDRGVDYIDHFKGFKDFIPLQDLDAPTIQV